MRKYPFLEEVIAYAPNENGVYLLYEGDELIYIGRAVGAFVTIRSRLQAHWRGDEGACTQRATAYGWHICPDGSQLEADLLAAYRQTYGRLPRCNSRIG